MIVDKYRPKNLSDLVGQEAVIERLKIWARNWDDGIPQKPILLYGRPGCGKTSIAHALANDMNWEIFEINASDTRNKGAIESILANTATQSTLTGSLKLIVVDEVDGLAGQEDRGGVGAIVKVIQESRQPTILIANQVYIQKLKSLLPETEMIEMKGVEKRILRKYLKQIAEKEGIQISDPQIDEIADRSNGDVRSALIDLTATVTYRDREKDVYRAVAQVFKAQDYQAARSAFWDVDIDPDMQILWIEENIPNEYQNKEEMKQAYEYLSRADVFNGRITNRQSWNLLRYATELSTAGVASARKSSSSKFVKYKFPTYLQKMSYTIASRAILISACRKIGERMHLSSKEVLSQLRLIRPFILKNPEFYKLEESEIKSIQSYR
ncbi:MAG: replication factor C large subunit [Candidatus Micrarchaeota archaeon]|nr:replication factor C large subunit [Candidatus Micrarchaeota archaeon]